jgi:hypothetical protein
MNATRILRLVPDKREEYIRGEICNISYFQLRRAAAQYGIKDVMVKREVLETYIVQGLLDWAEQSERADFPS